jgi:ubiquinone/menaquinone biosynthesis C-methylase UbiE
MCAESAQGANREQIDFWNGPVAEVWVEAQQRLDASLVVLTEGLVRAAAVRPGERILDIGCGCGTTAIELAELGAHVTGIDVSRPMLAHARARASGREDVEFVLGDAATYEFSPDFDLLFSRFGVMFFADPVAAFRNLARAVKPGGRLCFLCWRSAEHNPWISVPARVVQSHLGPSDPVDPRAPGMFAFSDADYVGGILRRAGFRDVAVEALVGSNRLGADLDEAMHFLRRIGPMRRTLETLDARQRESILAAVREALTPYESANGVALTASAWIAKARAK